MFIHEFEYLFNNELKYFLISINLNVYQFKKNFFHRMFNDRIFKLIKNLRRCCSQRF